MKLEENNINIVEDVVIKKNDRFTMSHGCDSVAIAFDNVIAVGVDSWESSQIKASVRITDKTMDELCKAWLKFKKK